MSEWISVKKRLPETKTCVMMYFRVSTEILFYALGTWTGKVWKDYYGRTVKGITHWQPLPGPPKEKV